jgi:MYXO-CTERM domain-containing protein
MKISLTVLVATTFAANAASTIIDTTKNVYSISDRGNFALSNTGQTFTTGSLGLDTTLATIQLQQPQDFPGASSGDNITIELWTDTDGDHATWDPGTKLGGFTSSAVTFNSAGTVSDFSFIGSGINLTDSTVYAIRYLSDNTSGDTFMRFAVTKDSASPGAGGTYKDGTLFAGGTTPFSNGWDSGFSVTTVPEPTAALLGGLGLLGLLRRRRSN